jgi:hypothetical protein
MSVETLCKAKDYSATPAEVDLKSLLGGLLGADWRQALIARGYGWHVQVGALTTPIVGGGDGTVLDLEQPELAMNVPSGYTCIPLRINVQVQMGLQTTDSHETEIIVGVDRTQVQVAGTSTTESPMNMRTDIVSAAPFTCFSAYTGDGNATPVITELARKQALTDVQGTAATVNAYIFDLLYEPLFPPIIVGPANISVYFGGSIAASGFIQASGLWIPSSLVTGLS